MGLSFGVVRKHRAPKGALRPVDKAVEAARTDLCQKAPSAKRCIKTWASTGMRASVRVSESTERQKVH